MLWVDQPVGFSRRENRRNSENSYLPFADKTITNLGKFWR